MSTSSQNRTSSPIALVTELRRLAGDQGPRQRAVFAELRRGLGRKPGTTSACWPFVSRYIGPKTNADAAYTIASLFAAHPSTIADGRSLGRTCREMSMSGGTQDETGSEALRFRRLLESHRDELFVHLRRVVSMASSAKRDTPVDYAQLYWDIAAWDDASRKVQRRWASEFWGPRQEE